MVAIDRQARTVTTANGHVVGYDKVRACGVQFSGFGYVY